MFAGCDQDEVAHSLITAATSEQWGGASRSKRRRLERHCLVDMSTVSGTASIVTSGTASIVTSGTASIVTSGTASIVTSGTASIVTSGTASIVTSGTASMLLVVLLVLLLVVLLVLLLVSAAAAAAAAAAQVQLRHSTVASQHSYSTAHVVIDTTSSS